MELKKEDILELIDRFENSSILQMSFVHKDTSLELKKQESGSVSMSEPEKPAIKEKNIDTKKGEEPEEDKGAPVKAPLAGIFYRAPKPGAEAFVKTGQTVKKGDVVGIIEAMKMMNEITAPVSGRVSKINSSDGEFAQYGDVLMLIEEE